MLHSCAINQPCARACLCLCVCGGAGQRKNVYVSEKGSAPPPAISRHSLPVLWPLACLLQHVTFSSCPEEPAKPLLTPRPKALGLKIARPWSTGECTWREVGLTPRPSSLVGIHREGKRDKDRPKLCKVNLAQGSGKAPGQLEIRC